MSYQRKTRDVFIIQSNYGFGHGWEDECCESRRKDGLARLREYRENSPCPARMITRREKIELKPTWTSVTD